MIQTIWNRSNYGLSSFIFLTRPENVNNVVRYVLLLSLLFFPDHIKLDLSKFIILHSNRYNLTKLIRKYLNFILNEYMKMSHFLYDSQVFFFFFIYKE